MDGSATRAGNNNNNNAVPVMEKMLSVSGAHVRALESPARIACR